MHLMLEFFVGAWDWFKVPIPIYAVVEGFVATARMRIQFVQQAPFVRNLTVTLVGVPKVGGIIRLERVTINGGWIPNTLVAGCGER